MGGTIRYAALRVLALAVPCAACEPVYVQAPVNAPMLRSAGEVAGSAHVGSAYDVQLAYAVTDRLAVIGTASYAPRKIDPANRISNHSHLSGELGVGSLLDTGPRSGFELFGGLGFGRSTGQVDEPRLTSITGDYYAPFVQGDFNWTPRSRVIELAGVLRVQGVAYRFRSVDGTPTYDAHRFPVFVQPAAVFRAGGEHLKFDLQLGLNARITQESAPPFTVTSPFGYIGVGIFGRIGGRSEPDPGG